MRVLVVTGNRLLAEGLANLLSARSSVADWVAR
jgi:hypothetical protein